MDFDNSVPAACDDGVVCVSITYERYFPVLRVMAFQLVDHDSAQQIEDLDLAEVITYDKFAMTVVELHASYITFEYVLQNSHWFALFRIPDLD